MTYGKTLDEIKKEIQPSKTAQVPRNTMVRAFVEKKEEVSKPKVKKKVARPKKAKKTKKKS